MSQEQFDYIIVGAGIAGITLSMHLQQQGKKLLIIDSKDLNHSSAVAAGLFNPITGRKMVKTWEADKLFPYLQDYYKQMEELTKSHFFHLKSIYRPFFQADEQNEWMGKSADSNHKMYVKNIKLKPSSNGVIDKYGGLELVNCGYLDVPKYLEAMTSYLSKSACLLKQNFQYQEIKQIDHGIMYGNYTTKKVIFCEGTGVKLNPFFNWLPLRPVKGELLYIKTSLQLDYILNRGVFVLPLGNGIYKVGATYENHDLTLEPTDKGRKQLIQKLEDILTCEFEIIDQVVGLRPSTKDRKPFLGIHPEIETFAVFNGLGAKGVSLAPFWSQHFVDFLENNQKLNTEVSVARYFSLYSKTH